MTYTCVCGQTKTEEIPALGHTHNWATEYSKDETHHWYDCSGCDEVKDKAEHDWDDGVESTPATETTPGVMTYTCVCGQTKTEEIPALGHTHNWADEYSKDETHHWYDCSGCDEVKDKAEHDWDDGVETTPATETTPGVMTYTCICGQTMTEEIPALGHTHNWATEYSKDDTHHWYDCSGCDEVKDKAEHDWDDGVESTPATETTPGVMTYTCVCGQTKTEEIPALGHTHNWATEYSKDETHHWYDCSGCDEVKSKAKHTEGSWIVDKEPTAMTEGSKHTECVVCGYVMDTDTIPVVDSGFDYDSWWYMMQILMNQKFTITANAGEGGSITDEGKTTVKYNSSKTYVITPDEGYEIEAVIVNGKNIGAVPEYTFKGVNANQTISVTFAKTVWKNPFIDIFETDSYYDAIEYVYENKLFKGVSANEFAPETTMTRAMFVTVLGRLASVDEDDYTDTSFEDAVPGTWYAPYVEWAADNGIVNGYGNGLFGVEDEITIEQAVVILARFADYIGVDLDTDAVLERFFDADEVADWAVEAMKWAVDNDIYEGINGRLNPKAPAKRWMLAEMLLAFDEAYGE